MSARLTHARGMLRCVAALQALPLLPDASQWRSLTPEQWAALFMPGVAATAPAAAGAAAALGHVAPHAAAAAAAVATRQYLLAPVGGSAAYERRGRTEGPPGAEEAAQRVALRLDTLAGRLSREQVGHFQQMGAALSAALRRAPHAHLRPRAAVRTAPAAWWRYAVAASADAARAAHGSRLRWEALRAMARARRRYVTLYKAHVAACAKKAGWRGTGALPMARCANTELLLLESTLEPETALLFRVLAHCEVTTDIVGSKPKAALGGAAAAAPAAAPAAAAPAAPSRLARFFGYRSATAAAAEPASPAAGSRTPTRTSSSGSSGGDGDGSEGGGGGGGLLSSDDWAQLTEAFELTDAKLSAAAAAAKAPLHPDAMQLLATLSVDVGSVQLVSGAAGAPPLLFSSLEGVSAQLQQFGAPRLCARLGVAALAADAAGVALLRTALPGCAADAAAGAPPALALEYEKAPRDAHADTVLSLATAPVHVTADLAAVRGLVSFFAKPPELDTAALAQTMGDTVSDAAAAAAAAAEDGLKALQGRPLKMDLRLAVAAPKILLPTPGGAGLLLDLGFLQLASVAAPAGAPRGTDCFALSLNDVSAVFVERGWDWSRLGDAAAAAAAQPLLAPTGLEAQLVRSAAPGPGRPGMMLSVDVSAMAAEVSPSAVASLVRVLGVLSPLWTRAGAPWANAQHEAPLWVLTRNGATPGRLVWARRWGVLAGEYLYLLEARDTPANARVALVSLRLGMEAAPLSARAAAGEQGVFAVLPHGVLPAHAMSHSRATLLRGDDAAGAAGWVAALRGVRKRRHAAAARRHGAAAALVAPEAAHLAAQLDSLDHLIEPEPQVDDDADDEAFADATDDDAAPESDGCGGPGADDRDDAADRFSDAESEVPSEESDASAASGSDAAGAAGAGGSAAFETFVLLARMDTLTVALAGLEPRAASDPPAAPRRERPVVTLCMGGAAVRYGQRLHDYSLAVRLQSLLVVDRLAPAAPPGAPAPYVLTSEAAAVADTFPHYLRRTSTAPCARLDDALAHVDAHAQAGAAAAGADDATALVRFSYRTWTENSPDYAGEACAVTARLAAVALALRRPTVVALAALGWDYAPQRPPAGAPAASREAPAVAEAPAGDAEAHAAAVAATAAALVAWAAGDGPEERVAPVALGGAPRVVMRIDVAMESALLQLLLEGPCRVLSGRCIAAPPVSSPD
jgi:hypothetical protein